MSVFHNPLNLLKSLPIQLVLCIIVALALGGHLPEDAVRGAYTLSCAIKELLMLVLPIIIFSYLAAAILSIKSKAPLLILALLVLITISNAIAGLVSMTVGSTFLPLMTLGNFMSMKEGVTEILPFYCFQVPDYLPPDKAMFLGVIIGLFFSFVKVPKVNQAILKIRHGMEIFLQKVFIPLLPLYVLGFVLKMEKEGVLEILTKNYGQILILFVILNVIYILFLYLIGSGFRLAKFSESLKNMIPAGITGFSTMSSAATMPVTLVATEKNLKNPDFADLVIPTSVNIHLMTDCLGVPLMVLSIMMVSGMGLPEWSQIFTFLAFFVAARFSVPGIPGGGVIVLLPVFEKVLGFKPEMLSLITTLYILKDPLITTGNVMGNGAFAILSEKIMRTLKLI